MHIWLVGRSGMLGWAVENLLKERKIPYTGTSSSDVDITDLKQVEQFSAPYTHIINCAAYTQVDKAESEQESAYKVNAIGPENLGRVAEQRGARIIHISTDYVFDGQATTPYTEEAPCAPQGVYGTTKREGEERLLKVCPTACIIRTSWLYGHNGPNFVATMCRLMNERDTLNVVADQEGRPTFCNDLAGCILSLIEASGIYHFANSGTTTWHAFAEEIGRLIESKCQVNAITTDEYPTPAKRPPYSVLSLDKVSASRHWKEALTAYFSERA